MSRFLIWGGLGLVILGIGGCFASTVGVIGAGLEGDTETAEAGGAVVAGTITVAFVGFLMIGLGALAKAIKK